MPKEEFWKISKSWVQDCGLSADESLLLSDIISGLDCTHDQRAERLRFSRRHYFDLLKRLQRKSAEFALFSAEFALSDSAEFALKKCRICTKRVQNLHSPLQPPYIKEKQEKQEPSRSARVREVSENGNVKNFVSVVQQTPPPNPLPADAVLVKKVSEWEQEHRAMIAEGSEWANSLYRLYRIQPLQLNDYLAQFTDHCTAQGEDYKTLSDYRKHLTSWLRYRINDLKKQPNGQATIQQRQHVTHYDGPADFRP